MSYGVRVDPKSRTPARKASRTSIQHLTLSVVEVVDTYVEVHLLRVFRVRPARWP